MIFFGYPATTEPDREIEGYLRMKQLVQYFVNFIPLKSKERFELLTEGFMERYEEKFGTE